MLRRAAALMRERAEAATAGPWEPLVLGSEGYAVVQSQDPSVKRRRKRPASVTYESFDECRADAAHIAGMDPAVAKAVADLLDDVADDWGTPGPAADDAWRHEVAVARAYLGSDS